MENFSKNKGRPKSDRRKWLEGMPAWVKGSGSQQSLRSQMNWAFSMHFLDELLHAPEDIQRDILGCTGEEIRTGGKTFPKGFKMAAEAAGRWIAAGNDPSTAVIEMMDARNKGLSFSKIAAHFRRLRLGDKQGNEQSLLLALARTMDRYRRQFPSTKRKQERVAITRLLEMLDEEQ